MSNIDKEWLQKKIAEMEAARDEIPFGLDEDDSNTLAAMKLALASLEAEAVGYMNRFTGRVFTLEEQPGADTDAQVYVPVYAAPPAPAQSEPIAWLWSHRKHPSEVTLVRPEDDEKAEGAHWSGWSCQALYAAPPAPVSVPDEWKQWIADAVEYLEGGLEADGELEAEGSIEAKRLLSRRAAMLQGADGALTNEDTKRVDELVMWIKRLAHSLRKAKPDSKLQSDAMDYLSRKGLIGVEDILR